MKRILAIIFIIVIFGIAGEWDYQEEISTKKKQEITTNVDCESVSECTQMYGGNSNYYRK